MISLLFSGACIPRQRGYRDYWQTGALGRLCHATPCLVTGKSDGHSQASAPICAADDFLLYASVQSFASQFGPRLI